ncbi:hypothetical protein O6H91_04G069600 [Diphasiastrum complanatum]|nr:hypothetical protein O6H91_04G069600 [Diphasiastrum complanatum]
MVEVSWAPMLAAFSVPLDKSEDGVVTYQCLEGFRHAIHVTAVMCMQTQRDAFVTSLAKFTCLHSPSDIKQKNIDAIKTVLIIAEDDGNYLQEAWEHVLTCISRFEHLHLIGEGAPPDATFFAVQQNELEKTRQGLRSPVFPSSWRKGTGRMQYSAAAAAVARRGSYDSAGAGGLGSGAVTTEQMNNLVSNLNMLEQIDSLEVNKIFSRSHRLNSEAIVDFVKALCRVSMEELRSNSDPRVFSLTKIVEISHFNMNRIRLVWSRMWNVLADFFVTVGCSDNLSVAMYVMDSLRQLAMKFLEREELANYNFQNQFMKPFVVVMQKSSSVEIRELIIRCVSQMVFARVSNVKSGWKIMFMVFTTAATDEHKNIVLLAFETIEKIVREYFTFITETETNTFTDCVNCLIAFTNSRFNQDICLNAIAFLRFCALKLAEGELGSSAHNKENTTKITTSISASERQGSLDIPSAADKDDYLHFWFPLLAGLSELTFDTRPDIRKSALEVLSDTLRYHGHIFPPDFWERIFESILFPIFENVQRETESGAAMHPSFDVDEEDQVELEKNNWLYETCTVTFQLLVDLLVKFYAVISSLLERFLLLMKSFVRKLHQRLASVGVAAFVRLISNAGYMFSEGSWHIVLSALKQVTTETLPDLGHIVGLLEKFPIRSTAGEHNTTRSFKLKVDEVTKRQKDVVVLLSFKFFEVNCHVAVQLLLVQAISEVYNLHGALLISESNTILLLDTLQLVARHAYHINLNYSMREKLQKLQPSMQFPDPPLLRLESESYNAYLLMLQQLPGDKPGLAQMGLVETRLVELCEEVLQVYLKTSALGPVSVAGHKDKLLQPLWVIPLASARRRELAARAPLVVATLRAVGGLEISSFQRYLVRFFPLLVNLVSCEHGSVEVQLALSNMFSSSIWPVLSQA